MLRSVNENFFMTKPLYLYLFGSAFLVSFTEPNKQLFNVKSVFKFLNDRFSTQEIYIYLLFFKDINIIF